MTLGQIGGAWDEFCGSCCLGFAGVCLMGHVVWVLRLRELFLLGMNGRARVQQ